MTNPYTHRIDGLVADVRQRAANIDHEWDRRAIDWPLTSESTVVEVGGYCGRWALQIAERYHPRLFVFEPQPWAAEVCRVALGDSAQVIQAALGDTFAPAYMSKWETDGCSLVGGEEHQVTMIEIEHAFKLLKIGIPDLMLMNIEGYEYVLLPHMLDKGILPKRLMVQFHDHADPDGSNQSVITQRLFDVGYRVVWSYWALTAWERD